MRAAGRWHAGGRKETRLMRLIEAAGDLALVVAEMKVNQAEAKSPPEREQY